MSPTIPAKILGLAGEPGRKGGVRDPFRPTPEVLGADGTEVPFPTAGSKSAMRALMMAMTISRSIRVKAPRDNALRHERSSPPRNPSPAFGMKSVYAVFRRR